LVKYRIPNAGRKADGFGVVVLQPGGNENRQALIDG
jgi:hypothetical protein